jgi:hypothetical protein
VFWAVLFLLGYVLVTIGAGVILYRPIATIMTEPPNHTHADLREDQVWAALVVTIGYAVLWPLTLGLYALARSVAAAAE